MDIIDIIFLVLILISLNVNFKKDRGQYKKAKITHTIIVCFLFVFFTGDFTDPFLSIIKNSNFPTSYIQDPGILPQEIAYANSYIYIIISIMMIILIFSLVGRNKKALTQLKYILPISVITQNIHKYLDLLKDGGIKDNHSIIFYSGFFFFAIPAFIIIKIYKKDFMKKFYNSD